MNKAIERIKGYCCEVNEQQWEELVRVADEVGVDTDPFEVCPSLGKYGRANAEVNSIESAIIGHGSTSMKKRIPFPDFLAKLKGEDEEWQPKAGEMVEVGGGYVREYIAERGGKHFCWGENGESVSSWPSVKQLRTTITRAEAEQIIGKRIID